MARPVIGFLNGEPTTPEDQGLTPERTVTLAPGETVTDTHGNTYTADAADETLDD